MSDCYRPSMKCMYRGDGVGGTKKERDGVSAKRMDIMEGWGFGLSSSDEFSVAWFRE